MVRMKHAAPPEAYGARDRQRARPYPPPPLPWALADGTHRQRYEAVSQRPLGDTRYVHSPTMRTLQIENTVLEYLDRIGWRRLATLNLPAYRELTFEFLSSLSLRTNPDGLSFRLMGVNRYLSLEDLNTVFGFDHVELRRPREDFSVDRFWSDISPYAFQPGNNSVTKIRDSALRYIHRLMTHTVFGRGESNNRVSNQELFFMWCILHRVPVNTGAWLIPHFRQMAKTPKGKIVGAGMITHIAISYGFDMRETRFVATSPARFIDLLMCMNSRLCERGEDGLYYLLAPDGHRVERQPEDTDDEDDVEMGQPDDPDAEDDLDDAEAEDDGAPIPDDDDDTIPQPLHEHIAEPTHEPRPQPMPDFMTGPSIHCHGSSSSSTPQMSAESAYIVEMLRDFRLHVDSRLQHFTTRFDRVDSSVQHMQTQLDEMRVLQASGFEAVQQSLTQMRETYDGRLGHIEDILDIERGPPHPPPPPPPPEA